MNDPLPIVFIPGLNCSTRLYTAQLARLWYWGPVMVADTMHDDDMLSMVHRILTNAPRRFALVGLSMGGYAALAIMDREPERVAKLALLDTSARSDTPEQSAKRRAGIAMAEDGRFQEIVDAQYPLMVHRNRANDAELRDAFLRMTYDVGPMGYINQQKAIISRRDSRNSLYSIRCPTLVLVGDGDQLTPPELSEEIANGIEGSKLVVVPDCGHLSTLERPDEVSQALEDWIRS
jgi:pimeloyl-ACP methyl ester carboxylesterase